VTRLLIEKGADVSAKDETGWTALMAAAKAKGDHADIVKLLIKNGAEVNAKNDRGVTALQYATGMGNFEL